MNVLHQALFLTSLAAVTVHGDYLNTQTFMNLQEAEARYGTLPFSASVFKSGTTSQAAKMAVSLN